MRLSHKKLAILRDTLGSVHCLVSVCESWAYAFAWIATKLDNASHESLTWERLYHRLTAMLLQQVLGAESLQ